MYFRDFVKKLEENGLLTRIKREVSTEYEISTLMRMLDGRALLFEKVRGYDMPVVANVCSTREMISLGMGIKKEEITKKITHAIDNPSKPAMGKGEDIEEALPDLSKIPILKYYPQDGGPYIASAIVVAELSDPGTNVSYHRMMVIDKDRIALRILPRHFDEFIKRGLNRFAICIGAPVQVLVAGAISAEFGKSELDIANTLEPYELVDIDGFKVPKSEIVMIASFTGEMHEEGPFVDLTQTKDIERKQRVAKIEKIFMRKGALYHALLPGGLEHKELMGMPKEPTIFREVNRVCECKDVYITPGGCSWLHGVVSIKKKSADDGIKAIEAAFQGHKSMKHVFIVDEDIDVHDPSEVEWAMATRFQDGLVIKRKQTGSSLDPSADPETRETTKIGFDFTRPLDKPEEAFKKVELPLKLNLEDYL
ncbi:MAG: UbiD family decarboxylase [Candidatus Thermoplasmatota archaeon]|nr:UbiD family decarboxylase [Candidatus Thermoplasmatota archaeon]